MTTVQVRITIKAPIEAVLKEFSDYKHAPILHDKYVRSVQVLQQDGDVSVALWRLKVLWFWYQSKQRQTVFPPDRLENETIGGFALGTVENAYLREGSKGTNVTDIVEIRIPKWGRLIEKIIAFYTKHMVTDILIDHKRDLESRYGTA